MQIWMDVDIAIAEAPVNIMPLIDDTDFKSVEDAVVYNAAGLSLIWHFVTTAGVMTETAVVPTTAGVHDWTGQGTSGIYAIEIPASAGTINNDTEGFGWFTGVATGVLPWRGPIIGFRAAGLNNLLIDDAYSASRALAGTALPNAEANAAGGLATSAGGATGIDDLATPTNITAGTISTATNLTNLPAIPTNWLTAVGINAGALDNKGNWNVGKTGYSLSQSFPTNFADLAITLTTGRVDINANNDKTGYGVTSLATDVITAASIQANALTGKGNWNVDKTGYSISATGLDLILQGSDFGLAMADAIWDEILTGATHNITNSAGKRVRDVIDSVVIYTDTAVSATVNSITLPVGASAVDGTYDPADITIVGGTGVGQSRLILQYAGTTKTAIVDRNWKTIPDGTSAFAITTNAGREHVNEGLAQAGGTNTITLNTLASGITDVYVGQIVFIRSGTGDDQSGTVIAYNGTTKIATIHKNWGVQPDGTSAYVMLPASPVEVTDNAVTAIQTGLATSAALAITDGVVDDIKAETLLIVGDTNELQTDWTDGGRLDTLLDAIPTDPMRGTDDAALASVATEARMSELDEATAGKLANQTDLIKTVVDALTATLGVAGAGLNDVGGMSTAMKAEVLAEVVKLLTTQMTESYAANGVAPTLAQAQFAKHQMLMQFGAAGTSITVRQLDDTTTAFIVTLDDAATPTDAKRI